jgi:hypothetical protein
MTWPAAIFYFRLPYQNLILGGQMETTIPTELLELKAQLDRGEQTANTAVNQFPTNFGMPPSK